VGTAGAFGMLGAGPRLSRRGEFEASLEFPDHH